MACPQLAMGQIFPCYNSVWYRANAKSGLNLRERPSRTAKKVTVIPYHELLASCWQEEDAYGLDTIDGLPGYWRWVSCKNAHGYVFSEYLTPASDGFSFALPDHLLAPIDPRPWLKAGQTYFGLRPLGKNQFRLEQIATRDSLVIPHPGMDSIPEPVEVCVENPESYLAIFSGVPGLDTRPLLAGKAFHPDPLLPGHQVQFDTGAARYTITVIGTVSQDKTQLQHHGLKITCRTGGKSVTKNYLDLTLTPVREGSDQWEGGIILHWVGDLDQDGKLDMILSYSQTYKGEEVVLLLSSWAEAGHLFKSVFIYGHSCC